MWKRKKEILDEDTNEFEKSLQESSYIDSKRTNYTYSEELEQEMKDSDNSAREKEKVKQKITEEIEESKRINKRYEEKTRFNPFTLLPILVGFGITTYIGSIVFKQVKDALDVSPIASESTNVTTTGIISILNSVLAIFIFAIGIPLIIMFVKMLGIFNWRD